MAATIACPGCGEENPIRARYCLGCGKPLAPVPPPEIRKVVTVLFTDITGSTELGERLDPESVRALISRFFEEMRRVIERHGGSVEKFIGDAVMAVFGVPVLHEDDALRAVRAAADMREELRRLNDELHAGWGVRLRATTGVNTGEVVVGDVAAGGSTVVGDAVNVAARLQDAAEPGEIVIGPDTYRLVRDAVEAERADLSLKGKRLPVHAYRLRSVAPRAPGYARRLDAPMVGRARERALLTEAFERAVRERRCHLFAIFGAAGVGKSRLAAETVSSCRPSATVLSGRCPPYGEGMTFWPIVEVVQRAASLSEEDPPATARAKISALLENEPDRELVAARIAHVVGASDVAGEPEETWWAVRRLLEALARQQPLVVLLDDLHWAEPTLLELIEYVATTSRDAPILLVCLARPELLEGHPGWPGDAVEAASVTLEPLTGAESELLIKNLLDAELSPDARERVTQAAEGNPLFVEELLFMLIDAGALRPEDGRWVATADLSSIDVPPTIHALLSARLDRLEPQERAVIERAAIEGKVFHRGAVVALSPPEARAEIDRDLAALVRKELLEAETPELAGERAFAFRHILARDAAYRAIPKENRADLHARFAAWLSDGGGARAAQLDELVGYHLERAYRYREELGVVDEIARTLGAGAAAHLGRAGRRALDRGDVPAAINLLERTSSLLPDRDPRRPPQLLRLSEALAEAGEFARAQEVLRDTIASARQAGDRVTEWRARMEEYEIRIQVDPGGTLVEDAHRDAQEAIAVFEELGDESGLASAWLVVALTRWHRAEAGAAHAALERAVRHARLAGDLREEVEALTFLSMASAWSPVHVEEAIRRNEEILERGGGHRKVEAFTQISRGVLMAHAGHIDEGRKLVEDGRAILRDLGLRVLAAATAQGAGFIELLAGDSAAAERVWREGLEALDRMGEKAYLSTMAAYLADALYAEGRVDQAARLSRLSEDTADPGDLASQIGWRSTRGKVLAAQGDLAEAERLARDAVTLAEGTDFLDTKADTRMDLAEVLRVAGRTEEARRAMLEAIGLYERKGYAVRLEQARRRLQALER